MKDSEDWFKLDFSGMSSLEVAQSQSKGTLGELGGGQSAEHTNAAFTQVESLAP